MASDIWPLKGVAEVIPFDVYDYAGKLKTGAAFGTLKVDKDFAGFLSATNVPVERGNGEYTIALTNAEKNADVIVVTVPITGLPDLTIIVRTAAYGVDSVSTYAGADTAGTGTLLARIPGTVQPQTGDSYARLGVPANIGGISADIAAVQGTLNAGVVVSGNNDKIGYSLTTGEHTAIAANVQTGMTAQGYTVARAAFLDVLNGIVAAIWAAATRTLSAFGFSPTVGGYAAGQDPATLVLDTAASGHNTAATIGAKINASGASGDPLVNAVPGSYAAGTAGAALGTMAAIKAKTDLIVTGAAITLTSPVGAGGNVVIYNGDDYKAADSRQLIWSTTASGAWPDLTGATVKFYSPGIGAVSGIPMVISTPSGATKSIYLELTLAQTTAAPLGLSGFQIRATLADAGIVTLVTGTINVLKVA